MTPSNDHGYTSEPPVLQVPAGETSKRAAGVLGNVLFALSIGGVLSYGAVFAWYVLGRSDLVDLIRDVNFDDSFYYFQIAWHMAAGKFSTFDGGITQTNGYHPLWMLLITPFYWVFDKVEALFAIKAFEIMLIAGGIALVVAGARLALLPSILVLAALPGLFGNLALYLGLESAAALAMLGLFLLAICLYARDPDRWRLPLAAVAFALPWVRLEYAAVSFAATAALLLIEWSYRDPPPRAPAGARARPMPVLKAFVPLLAAGAGLLAYFAWNGIVFGGAVPVSGAVKLAWSQQQWEREGGYDLTRSFHEFRQVYVFNDELLFALEICVYVALVWWFARRSRSREDRLLLAFLVGVFGLAAGHLAKFVQNVLIMHPEYAVYGWTFVPAYLLEALMLPVRCFVAIWFIRSFVRPIPPLAVHVLSLGAAAVFLWFTNAKFIAPFELVDRRIEENDRRWETGNHMSSLVMDRLLPEDSVIGSWDAGVTGYFSRFPVVNLDGLVNSWEYLRDGKDTIGPLALFQRYGITHFANSRAPDRHYDNVLFEGPTFHDDTGTAFQYKIWPNERAGTPGDGIDRSGSFLERMEPHLERQADGVGLLVEGRMAQAFARDCAPDELVVWTWAGRGDEAFFEPWTKTRAGFCASAVVAPHDALPPLRAEVMTVEEYLTGRVGEREPAIRSDFDVYLLEGSLIYVKEPCRQEDVDARFFVGWGATDPDDLPSDRRQDGYELRKFEFDMRGRGYGSWSGVRAGETCLAEFPLPEYGIPSVSTGQYVIVEGDWSNIWEGTIRFE